MPDVDGRAGHRLTRTDLDEAQRHEKGRAGQALGDVAADLAGVEVEGALGLGRRPDAIVEGNRVCRLRRGVGALDRGVVGAAIA